MVGSSILPIAYHKRKLYFLFGKENSMEDSAKGWSDFGGGVEYGDSILETAMREGGEELTGFLGGANEIKKLISRNGGIYKINHNDQYHIHAFLMDYDENLPTYYNQNHRFLWQNMDKHILNDSKLFEKIEIEWFSPQMMRDRRNEFRGFYREIVDKILGELPMIKKFICKKKTRRMNPKNRKTFKKRAKSGK